MPVQTILTATASAAATGSWIKTNYNYTGGDDALTFYVDSNATAAGDLAIEAAIDENGTAVVCIAPFPAGDSVTVISGLYPYVRAKKAANTNGGTVYLVERVRP